MNARSSPERYRTALITIGALVVFSILGTATTHYRYSDAFYVTEVADRLINEGRVDLENFEGLDRIHPGQRVNIIDGKPYHYYPIGVVMSHVPGVLLAKALGIKPYENDASLQKYNSMFIIALCWIVFITTIFRVFGDTKFKFLTLLIFITSPIIGSLGSAHWNTTPALLIYFLILSLVLDIVYVEKGSQKRLLVLGFLIGTTIVVRPTCLAAIVPVGALVCRYQKKLLLQLIISTAFAVLFWLGICKILYGAAIPSYFHAHNLNVHSSVFTIFAGILFSPARGFFVFAPLYIIVTLGFFLAYKRIENTKDKWVGLALFVWIIIHWCGVVAFSLRKGAWWGGWCFGPRLLVETLPMWFFLACITQKYFDFHKQVLLRWLILATLIWGAFLNIIQSQYNPYTFYWNASISQEHYPEVFWDWEYPQWLNDAQRHDKRLDKYGITHF